MANFVEREFSDRPEDSVRIHTEPMDSEMQQALERLAADREYLDTHDAEFRVQYRGLIISIINQEVVATGRNREELFEALKEKDLLRPGDLSVSHVGRYYFKDEAEELAAKERAISF